MAVAVSRARELGARRLFVPSAGNAGVALAAYGARAGLGVTIYLPERTPEAMVRSCRQYGAEVIKVPGTIADAGRTARAEAPPGSFDVSTLREPYRVEGKKTMGLEIADQTRTAWPDAIVYPTGGGTGLIGLWKAFRELEELGALPGPKPRLYAVQPEGCAPVVRALEERRSRVDPWESPSTVAPGLLVPSPFAGEWILRAVRESHGEGVRVTDREIVAAVRTLAGRHGLSASPEAAAPFAAIPHLVERGAIRPRERVLLYQTGTGLPFALDELERAVSGSAHPGRAGVAR